MIEITDDVKAYVNNAVQRLMNDGCSRIPALKNMYLDELAELNNLGNDEDARRTVMARFIYINQLIRRAIKARLIYIDQLINAERSSNHVRRVAQAGFTLDELN